MRTRNANTPKTPASQKKTPPAKKAAPKTPASTPPESTPDTSNPQTAKTPEVEAEAATPSTQSKLETPVEQAKGSAEETTASPATKQTPTGTSGKKVTKRVVKRKVLRPKTPASSKAATAASATEKAEADEVKVEDAPKDEDTVVSKDDGQQKSEVAAMKDAESSKQEDLDTPKVDEAGKCEDKGKAKVDVDNPSDMDAGKTADMEEQATEGAPKPAGSEEPSVVEEEKKGEQSMEEVNDGVAKHESEKLQQDKADNMDVDQNPEDVKDDQNPEDVKDDQKPEVVKDDQNPENVKDDQNPEDVKGEQKAENVDDKPVGKVEEEGAQAKDGPPAEAMEDYGEEEGFVEPGEEDLQEDDEPESVDDYKASDEEHKELAAAAKERKIKKELEIFVGGLDLEVVEDDVKKAFDKIGEVLEVRLLKDPSTNKNRGFAFVRFATKEQAKRALSEMKNPVIRGKRCGAAPNEDNDTLFIGNICNTWTKEAIKQKLKDYNVEGVENITLVQDPRHEGLSRGFCFIQFACHADAMFAYKRLQKPDAIFGHTERTAKVAFAEPLQEPDPAVMAKVKSVFVDGLPPHWDEDRVRKHFKNYGEIVRITLARNMSSAKRKDFGFVDFTTHEAAITCIDDLKSKELVDGNVKAKVKARLSNPQPKTQAVKGGMCGGFRIGRPSGRSFGRPGPSMNRPNFPYGRAVRGQFNDPVGPYGRRAPFRAAHGASGGSAAGRPNFGGPRHGVVDRGFARPIPPRREPFPLEDGGYSRPYMGRHYDDPYYYDDGHGLKRPFYMTDQDPSYMEPSRVRPRFDYSDSGRGTHFRDTYGAGSSLYSSGYYGPEYGARPHSSFNGRDRSYGGGSGYYY